MKRIYWIALAIILIAISSLTVIILRPAHTPSFTDANGNEIPKSIASIETIKLGGVEQTITIRGENISKPVLLILHGGPGVPSAPWATWKDFHRELEKNFILVHWDQRGAGKSFSKTLTPADMHIENFVDDTLELTNMLKKRFNREKIFLWGHSWGSGLGFMVLRKNSEPYYAFIASGVRPSWDISQEIGYKKILEIVIQENDNGDRKDLESIQPFDPTNFSHIDIRNRYLDKYLRNDFHTLGLADEWLNYAKYAKSPEYPWIYIPKTIAGIKFSQQTIGQEIIDLDYNLSKDFPESSIPVYFFQGKYDYNCPSELAEEYFKSLKAPIKKFILFENSAHNVYYDEPEKFNKEIILIASEVLMLEKP